MSDTVFKIIPERPEYIPSQEEQNIIIAFLDNIFDPGFYYRIEITDDVNFIDQGSNFDSLNCPKCSQSLDMGWWSDQVELSAQSNFTNLNILLPCCGNECSLNDLDYDMPAGFSKYSIIINDLDSSLFPDIITGIEKIVSFRIRTVIARY